VIIKAFLAVILLCFVGGAHEISEQTIIAIKSGDLKYFENKNVKALAESSNKNGKTALMLAVWEQKPQIIELFLKNGANPNLMDSEGKTGLMLAVWKEDLPSVKLLIANGADKNIKNKEGLRAVDLASITGNGEIIDYLEALENGKK
jgi:ankyrin repeat protein